MCVYRCAFPFLNSSSWWWSRWSAWAKRAGKVTREEAIHHGFATWCHATRPSHYNFYYVFRQEHAKSTSSHWKSVFDTQFTLEKFHVFCVPLSPAGIESWFNLTLEDRLQCRACQLSRFWIQIDDNNDQRNQQSPPTIKNESRINQSKKESKEERARSGNHKTRRGKSTLRQQAN